MDQTTEAQLQTLMPYLVGRDIHTESGFDRQYCVRITNDEDGREMMHEMRWVPEFFFSLGPPQAFALPVQDKWAAMPFPFRAAYVLGWRHLSFGACVNVSKGVVSRTSYGLEPDVFLGWHENLLLYVHSAHGFWMRGTPVTIQSLDDESPDFRFSRPFSWFPGIDSTLKVAYTPNASPELIAHAFRVDLTLLLGNTGMRLGAFGRPAAVGGPARNS